MPRSAAKLLWAMAHGAANKKSSKRNRCIGSPHVENARNTSTAMHLKRWLRGRSLCNGHPESWPRLQRRWRAAAITRKHYELRGFFRTEKAAGLSGCCPGQAADSALRYRAQNDLRDRCRVDWLKRVPPTSIHPWCLSVEVCYIRVQYVSEQRLIVVI